MNKRKMFLKVSNLFLVFTCTFVRAGIEHEVIFWLSLHPVHMESINAYAIDDVSADFGMNTSDLIQFQQCGWFSCFGKSKTGSSGINSRRGLSGVRNWRLSSILTYRDDYSDYPQDNSGDGDDKKPPKPPKEKSDFRNPAVMDLVSTLLMILSNDGLLEDLAIYLSSGSYVLEDDNVQSVISGMRLSIHFGWRNILYIIRDDKSQIYNLVVNLNKSNFVKLSWAARILLHKRNSLSRRRRPNDPLPSTPL